MDENEIELEELPNASKVKTLGLVALVASAFSVVLYFIGLVISIGAALWAITLYKTDIKAYRLAPQSFDPRSYSRLVLGYFWAVLGLVISGIFLVIFAMNYGKDGLN